MNYRAVVETDIGNVKDTNQDSAFFKHVRVNETEILMAVVCDGMGGLSKGELASAAVIREFAQWFERELPNGLENRNLQTVGDQWCRMLSDLNRRIQAYGQRNGVSLGTTFSGILFQNGSYLIVHVGDSRVYHIGTALTQLTEDQTFVAREIRRGTMSPEEAERDKRRNLLLQCVGASPSVAPQVLVGQTQSGCYLLCSDGFRHEISEAEILQWLQPSIQTDRAAMHQYVRYLIDLVKSREERDNITAMLIYVE